MTVLSSTKDRLLRNSHNAYSCSAVAGGVAFSSSSPRPSGEAVGEDPSLATEDTSGLDDRTESKLTRSMGNGSKPLKAKGNPTGPLSLTLPVRPELTEAASSSPRSLAQAVRQ